MFMKKIVMIIAALALIMAGPVLAQSKPQTTCPVLGGNIDKNLYMDHKGQRVYFCCAGCDEEFKKDPEKYLEKMKSQGITPEKSPAPAGKTGK
jgi:YHS domain-containing protein